MKRTVDIYLPLDSREEPNAIVWPVTLRQLDELIKVIKKLGWKPQVLNPDKPVASVAEGLQVINSAEGERFINFMGGWAYPDFSVSPMWQLPSEVPKLLLGSAVSDFPGAVGLLAATSGTEQVGIRTDRMFVGNFEKQNEYSGTIRTFLEKGEYKPVYPETIDIPVTDEDREKAQKAISSLSGSIYGAIGPRSMQMWNKISEADFLKYFGIVREGFDGLRLLKLAEKVPDKKAEKALNFITEKGMDIRLGKNPKNELTREMVLFQMKLPSYFTERQFYGYLIKNM